ncbi:MAG: MATE family efflux transporter [Thermotogaceae bacterium]|nr:MATE family efflux transporter [Thermotogaceae bacterium]
MPKVRAKVDVFSTPIPKALLKLAWPIIITNLTQTLYNVVDAFWLGKLGKVKFGAPTVSFPIIFTFMSLANGLSSAGQALVAQYVGAGQKRVAEKSAMQVIVVGTFLSILLGIFGFYTAGAMLNLLGIGEPIAPYAESYLKIIFLGLPLTFLMIITQAIARGWGDTVFAMHVSMFSMFVNIILDPFMIFGIGFPRLEVNGAALATVIARLLAVVYSLYVLFKGSIGFKIHVSDIKPDMLFVKKILSIGIPGAVGQAITSSGFAVIMGIISRFGPAVVSAYGVGQRITSMLTTIGFAISNGVTTMVGQFLGAGEEKKVDEAVRWGFIEVFAIVGTLAVFLFLFADKVTQFFINDPEVIELGKIFFHLIAFSVPLFAMVTIVVGAFTGAGKTLYVAIINVTRLWGIRVPLVTFFANLYGFKGVFYAMAISNGLALLLGYTMLKLIRWKKKVI